MIVDGVASTEGAYQMRITLDGQARIAYCVDYFTLIDYAMYTSALATPDTIANGNRMAWIFVQYGATTTSADVAAAVQIAIWDLAHDNGDGINAGRIRLASNANSNVRSLSQSYLTASVNQSSTNATILFNTDPASRMPAQTLLTSYVPFSVSDVSVPEPSSAILLISGVLILAISRLPAWKQ